MSSTNQKRTYEETERRIEATMKKVKHRIAVFSGKGGVGKTTVSVNLGFSLQLEGFNCGLLDADITGPNVAKMLDIDSEVIVLDDYIVPFEKYGLKMISIASLIKKGQAIVWRGPLRSNMINQFLGDVDWGELDYLIADLPPGTGDEMLTIGQMMKPDYALIVTTPQEVALIDAERAIDMARKMEIPSIGIVENMAGFVCPHCGNESDIFAFGGGSRLAKEQNVEFLGSIPLDITAREMSDNGTPIIIEKKDSPVSKAFKNISNMIIEHYESTQKQTKE